MPNRPRFAAISSAVWLVFCALFPGGTTAVAADTADVEEPNQPADAQDQPESADEIPESLTLSGPVRFEADDAIIDIDGVGRFQDTIELSDVLVNELPMEAYVAGVAEMPSRWPFEALKAQAVAARTYAWQAVETGAYDNYDICATTACQVFRGAGVVLDGGEVWAQAVHETAGEVLVEDAGTPILARYYSTSGGRTYANEDVFSNGPRDYLVAFDDPYDEVSPYHRWEVEFARTTFDDLLSRGETLSAVVPIAAVERLGQVRDPSAQLRFTGADGTEVDVSAAGLRDFLSNVAPEQYPDQYPPMRSDGLRPLPSTIPSTRFAVEVAEDQVTVRGQGWGHGVGLGQYGARGRADDGHDYQQILAAYYNGLDPVVDEAVPERIRVGMDLPEVVEIQVRGDVQIVDADGEVALHADAAAWQAESDGGQWHLRTIDTDLDVADAPEVSSSPAAEGTSPDFAPLWLAFGAIVVITIGLLLFFMAVLRKGRT